MKWKWSVIVFSLAFMVLAPPIYQGFFELRENTRPFLFELFKTPLERTHLRSFEKNLENQSLFNKWAKENLPRLLDKGFKRGNNKIVFGKDDWLFYRPSLDYIVGESFDSKKNTPLSLQVIKNINNFLKEKNITLFIIPVPTKATVYPEKLKAKSPSDLALNNNSFAKWQSQLLNDGIKVIELTDFFVNRKKSSQELFLPRDTHWSPIGARLAAQNVAQEIRRHGFNPAILDPIIFQEKIFKGTGDLVKMLSYSHKKNPFAKMPLALRQVFGPDFSSVIRDQESQILLLGDSFSSVFSDSQLGMGKHSGFAEQIAAELNTTLDSIFMPGANPMSPWNVLEKNPQRLQNKKIILWQFSQRSLEPKLDLWHAINLDRLKDLSDQIALAQENVSKNILGQALDVSKIPENFAYENCLMIVAYQDLSQSKNQEKFFVAHRAYQDGKRSAQSEIKIGDIKNLTLEPVAKHFNLERDCWIDTTNSGPKIWWALEEKQVQASAK